MSRYYFGSDRHMTHRLRYDECLYYWFIYDRVRGYQNPLGFVHDVHDAQRIVDALNLGR